MTQLPDIKDIVADGDLTLYYQPQMMADGSRLSSVEALIRLSHPLRGLIGAAEILERLDAPMESAALDWWVLRQACVDSKLWPQISVAINVTAGRFRDPEFATKLMALIAEVGADPRRIELEIVEGAYINDFDIAVANIQTLRAQGIRVAIDDFGTGYSSLSYLLKLPVDKLKIDKSFIDDIGQMRSAAIVHAVIALSRALGLKITAEGVETEEQHRFLKLAGCHFMQGWLFSKAVPAARITELLTTGEVPRRVS